MLVHERFVFLQMRKTASTFLAEALARELPDASLLPCQKHAGWAKIPAAAGGRPVLAYVRNPWDWYVSWYHFNAMRGGMSNGYWRMLSQQGTLDFAATVRNALERSTRIMGADLYSTLVRNLLGDGLDSSLLRVAHFESMIDDLECFLRSVGVALSDGAFSRMREAAPLNGSDRGAYRDYYDDDLYGLVGECCAPLIERFGYGARAS